MRSAPTQGDDARSVGRYSAVGTNGQEVAVCASA